MDHGVPVAPTRWEVMLKHLGIDEGQAFDHPVARSWAKSHANRAYVPEKLLEGWGIIVQA